ncbi:MAG TPA: META domain-containing protein, partial [Bacteroidales bacterium]|nr:META domain-containing protein [Bacteroidales bacterium]
PDISDKMILIELFSSSIASLCGYCNSGSARYLINDNTITFINVTLTERGCPYAEEIWESYLYELVNVTSYKIEGPKLSFFTNSTIDLYFSEFDSLSYSHDCIGT